MYKAMQQSPKYRAEKKAMGFNISKLQAAACVALSVLASTGMIYFGVTAFL